MGCVAFVTQLIFLLRSVSSLLQQKKTWNLSKPFLVAERRGLEPLHRYSR